MKIPTEFLYPDERDIRTLLHRVRGARIGVIGDFCVDAYWVVDSRFKELSIETGKTIHHVREQRYSAGGAGNVAINLRALGVGQVEAFGVVGVDPFAQKLLVMLGDSGVGTGGLLTQARNWDTPVYGKPLLDGTETERLDFGAFNDLETRTWEQLLDALAAASKSLDFLVVNQQLPNGWCNQERRSWRTRFRAIGKIAIS
jgi:bifunctional ADP-heptose synthase (sugar kinase/adenylyltransferase)